MADWINRRFGNLGLSIISFMAILIAIYYFEGYLLYNPCPYCVLQRLVFALLGVIFVVAFLHNPKNRGHYLYLLLILAVTLLGLYLSGKHSWLQLQTYELNPLDGGCHQEVATIADMFNIDYLHTLLTQATGDCTVREDYLGLPIPVWTFITFLIVGGLGVLNNWRK